ncbi:MAG TPA: hypothetical protein PLE61_15645 [Vicinamibacterales bacterium]|nr:hypothetical protein [Vicinamibacterales bacterium]
MQDPNPIQLSAAQAETLSKKIVACVQQADQDQASRNDAIRDGRALFEARPERTNKPWDTACQITVPVCDTVLLQRTAIADDSLLQVRPVARLQGANKTAAADAEKFLDAFLTTVRLRERVLPAFQASMRDGSSALVITWRQEYRRQTRWETVTRQDPVGTRYVYTDPATGAQGEVAEDEVALLPPEAQAMLQAVPILGEPYEERQGTERDVLTHDGPHFLLLETGYLPGGTTDGTESSSKARWGTYPAAGGDIQESTGVFYRYTATGDDLLARVETGEFDADAVERLRAHKGDTETRQSAADQQVDVSSTSPPEDDFQWSDFDLVECYWRVPPISDPAKGETERQKKRREMARTVDYLITIHEPSGIVLRAIPNPWWHGKRPVVLFTPYRPTTGIHGKSIPDLVGDSQVAMTQILRDGFDMAQKRIQPPMKVKRGLLAYSERRDIAAQNKPGGMVEVDHPESVQVMAEGLGDPNAGTVQYEIVKDYTEVISAVNEQNAGKIKGNATATEVQVAAAKGEALDRHTRQNLAVSLGEVCEIVAALCYQFVGNESVQRTWAAANPKNQAQPGMAPGEWELSPEQQYTVTAFGGSDASNRALNRVAWDASFETLVQLPELLVSVEEMAAMAAMPEGQQVVEAALRRQYAAHRAFLDSRRLGDPEEHIGSEDDYLQLFGLRIALLQQQAMQMQQREQEMAAMDEQRRQREAAAKADSEGRAIEGKAALADQSHRQRIEQMQVQAALQPPQGGMPA